MQDPSGTKISVQETTRHVRYVLKREKNQWKIVEPAASEISPVILKSKVAFLP
jgi:hypothetical protein